MKSLYKSEEAKKEIHQVYYDKLNELNIEHEFLKLETFLGTTNIVKTGNDSSPPLLLIHGSNGCAPIALELFPNLSSKYCVYAVDVVAQPNLSSETRPSMKDNSYGKWINEIISQLNLNNVTLLGFSFGGFIIWKTLLEDESRIKESFLLAPVGIVNGNPFKLIFKMFLPMRMYMSSKKPKHLEKFLAAVFSERDDFAINFLSKVFLYFDMDFNQIPLIKKGEAEKIKTTINIIGNELDLIVPGEKLLKRSKKIFPSLKSNTLLAGSKHVQSMKDSLKVEQLVLD